MSTPGTLRFTDISTIAGSSPSPAQRKVGRKKRLSPLDKTKSFDPSTLAATVKTKKVTHRKELAEAVRKIQLNPHPKLSLKRQERKPPQPSENAPEDVPTKSELESLEDGVNNNARRYNDLKNLADRRQSELTQLQDELRDLRSENADLVRLRREQTEEGSRIMQLKRAIEKTTEQMEDKMRTRRQLEHMVQRLQRNQMTFDAHINGMEDTLNGAQTEYETVTLLLRQLDSGKAEAFHALQNSQLKLEQDRKVRQRVLDEKAHEASNAQRMEEWRSEREAQRQELAAELRGDLSQEQQAHLLAQLEQQESLQQELRKANKERSAQALTLEDAFMQIRQATGVNTLQEMLSKFVGQGANRAALEEEKHEAEDRLAEAKAKKEEAERRFAELKASGIGGTELNREIYEQLNQEIMQAKLDLKVNKAACQRLEGVLVTMRQGAIGLTQRLQPFASLLSPEDEANIPVTNIESLRMLHLSEALLTKMMEVISGDNGAATRFGHMHSLDGDDDEVRPDKDDNKPWTPMSADDPALSQNNVRVHSSHQVRRLERRESKEVAVVETGDDSGEEDDENSVKPVEDIVPSRSFLKLSSQRQFSETMRKREQAERRKQAMDKMLDENGERLPLTSQAARKKRQAAASKRLSKLPNQQRKLGLPAGITLKDDPMTKTHAYLTQRPKLL